MVNLIDQRDELVKLAALIDWSAFAHPNLGSKFESTTGRLTLDTSLMASLYLKHKSTHKAN